MTTYTLGTTTTAKGTVNVLPTAVAFTGTVPDGTATWTAYAEEETLNSAETATSTAAETATATTATIPVNYLRGRKLVGVPHEHATVVFESNGDAYTSAVVSNATVLYQHEIVRSAVNDPVQRALEWLDVTRIINN
jgi:hypothetical protein